MNNSRRMLQFFRCISSRLAPFLPTPCSVAPRYTRCNERASRTAAIYRHPRRAELRNSRRDYIPGNLESLSWAPYFSSRKKRPRPRGASFSTRCAECSGFSRKLGSYRVCSSRFCYVRRWDCVLSLVGMDVFLRCRTYFRVNGNFRCS